MITFGTGGLAHALVLVELALHRSICPNGMASTGTLIRCKLRRYTGLDLSHLEFPYSLVYAAIEITCALVHFSPTHQHGRTA